MTDSLTRLAIRYGTDKFGLHDYTPNYFKLFQDIQSQPINFLEIGVGGYADDDRGGQSLEMWRDFFVNGHITGIDIQKKTMDLGPRVKILQGSQVDPDFLKQLVAERGPFDVILDDGSHRNEHIVGSYELLFETLKPGGIYVMEDVQTSFFPRFGGSLDMTPPNSVGYFGDLMTRLFAGETSPLLADVAAIERFHNIIVVHKRTSDQEQRSARQSTLLTRLTQNPAKAVVIGQNATALDWLPTPPQSVRSADWSAPDGVGEADLVIGTAQGDTALPIDSLITVMGAMKDDSALILRSTAPQQDFAASSPLMRFAKQRFTEVDHREIAIHYPEYQAHPIAKRIYAIERFHDALIFHIAPNDFPSNFAWSATEPQSAAALASMKAVLDEPDAPEGGLVLLTTILARHQPEADIDGLINRMQAMGATSRAYFTLAVNRAQRRKDRDTMIALTRQALEHLPADAFFSSILGDALSATNPEEAEQILRKAREKTPRSRAVLASLSRVLVRQGNLEEASEVLRAAIPLFPRPQRPPRQVLLSRLYRRMGKLMAAQNLLTQALKIAPDDEGLLTEMGSVHTAIENARKQKAKEENNEPS